MNKALLVCVLALSVSACGLFQTQDSTQTLKARTEQLGENNTNTTRNEANSSQDSIQSSGAVLTGVEHVDSIVTENNAGLHPLWWLLIGVLIQQPRFIRWFF